MKKLLSFFKGEPILLREDQTLILTTSSAFVCLPHFFEIPLWCTVVAVFAIMYRFLSDLGRPWQGLYFPRPNRWTIYAICMACTYLIYETFGTFQGPEPSTALLVLLMTLKLLEAYRYRDAMIILILSYFVAMTWLLFSQTIFSTLYLLFAVMYSTASLVQLHSPPKLKTKRFSSMVFKDLLKAVPVCILLFFLFPRFASPFGNFISQSGVQTGFTGELDPGGISSLARSNEIAFRVRFLKLQIPKKDLYWRGSVLTHYEGLSWKPTEKKFKRSTLNQITHTIDQEIMIEPRFNRWLFGLDRPLTAKFHSSDFLINIGVSTDHEIRAPRPLTQPTLITVQSGRPKYEELSPDERQETLNLTSIPSEKLLKLAKEIKLNAKDNRQIARNALRYFQKNGFTYSLEPGPVASIDDFFFRAKKGFCEHYSAALATVMRVAGVPSRVIVGFYGGVYNEFGDYLIVRDREAHSWIEVWQEGEGWIRIDPTTSVSADRIRADELSDLATQSNRDNKANLFEKLTLAFDYINSEYTLFLINFDSAKQMETLSDLGISFSSKFDLILTCAGIILLFTVIIALISRSKNTKLDKVGECYSKLLRIAGRHGVTIRSSMGPLEVLDSVFHKEEFKNKEQFSKVIRLYVETRYGNRSPDPFIQEYKAYLAAK